MLKQRNGPARVSTITGLDVQEFCSARPQSELAFVGFRAKNVVTEFHCKDVEVGVGDDLGVVAPHYLPSVQFLSMASEPVGQVARGLANTAFLPLPTADVERYPFRSRTSPHLSGRKWAHVSDNIVYSPPSAALLPHVDDDDVSPTSDAISRPCGCCLHHTVLTRVIQDTLPVPVT